MDRGVANLLSNALLEAYYSTPTSPHGEMGLRKRTLSIEGRKLSQIQLPSGMFVTLFIKNFYFSKPWLLFVNNIHSEN